MPIDARLDAGERLYVLSLWQQPQLPDAVQHRMLGAAAKALKEQLPVIAIAYGQ